MSDNNPFELNHFRELSREGLRNKIIPKFDRSEEEYTMSLALSAAVKKVFYEKSEHTFSSEPKIEKKLIISFKNRMQVEAMEKFNSTTLLSVIHFYKDTAALNKNESLGLILVCVERAFVAEMLRLFQYPYIDVDEDAEVLDGAGAICNLIAGCFKSELAKLGYIDLEMSHFRSAINKFIDGIEFSKNQTNRYEVSFEVEGKKRIVVEMVMDTLPKKIF